jgi:hypothetical protein
MLASASVALDCLAGDPEVFWERMPAAPQAGRVLEARETIEGPPQGHLLDRALGWGAMAPLIVCAMGAWLSVGSVRAMVMSLAIIWGGAVLVFLAGVRRGLDFRTAGAARSRRILFVLWTFALAFGSMIALQPLTSVGLLILGYVGMALSERGAALREEGPFVFSGLRPAKMSIAALSLCAVAARLMWRS